MKEIRIIVAGSRDFDDYSLLKLTLKEYINGLDIADLSQVVIISGAARGADTLGEYFAYDYQIAVRKFPAKWDELVNVLVGYEMQRWQSMLQKNMECYLLFGTVNQEEQRI